MKVELSIKQYQHLAGKVVGVQNKGALSITLTEEQNAVLRDVMRYGEITIDAISLIPTETPDYIQINE